MRPLWCTMWMPWATDPAGRTPLSRPRHGLLATAEDRPHPLSPGQLVDQLVHPADPLHHRVLDVLDPHSADHARDECRVRVHPRGVVEEGLQVDLVGDRPAEAGVVVPREPRDDLVDLVPGAVLPLGLGDVEGVDAGEAGVEDAVPRHALPPFAPERARVREPRSRKRAR